MASSKARKSRLKVNMASRMIWRRCFRATLKCNRTPLITFPTRRTLEGQRKRSAAAKPSTEELQ